MKDIPASFEILRSSQVNRLCGGWSQSKEQNSSGHSRARQLTMKWYIERLAFTTSWGFIPAHYCKVPLEINSLV